MLSIALALAGLLALAAPAWAPPVKKDFNVCGGVSPACASPASFPIGSPVSATFKITSIPRTGSPLGSANLTLPSELVIVGAPTDPVVPAGKDWTAAVNGQTIELRNPGSGSENTLSNGESVSVTVALSVGCIPPRAPVTVEVKSSNDFSGNLLVGDNLPYLLQCVLPVADHLAFDQQPSDVISASTMTPPVTVRVEDSSNNLLTSFSGTVSLALGANPGSSTLAGGDPVSVVNGVATFGALQVVQSSTGTISGYTLVATSSPAVTSATSAPFAVTGQSMFCEFVTCTASSGNFSAPSATENWIGKVDVPTGDCPDTSCYVTAYLESGCPEGFTCQSDVFVFIPPVNETGLITVQIVCHSSLCPNTGPPGNNQPLFKVLANGDVVVLDRCHNSPPSGEDLVQGCITEIIRNRPGHTLFTIVLPTAGDPGIFK